jgi:hypothetical protein
VDLETFDRLLSPSGQAALRDAEALAPREVDFLAHFTALSRQHPPDLARAALETAILRLEAQAKFPHAARMYFTRPALEQATSHEVAAYRAERFKPFSHTADLGCSIGGDSLALAEHTFTLGLDLDPLRLRMAQANLESSGLSGRVAFAQADLSSGLPFPPDPNLALFFDPARRSQGRRIFSVADYHPHLASVLEWLPNHPALGVKISPGVKLDELAPYAAAELEFISLKGELKEGVLWFGPLRRAARRATVLPGPFSFSVDDIPTQKLPLSEPQAYLYEPDPSILRAGLVAPLGEQIRASQLDPEIAYLTADHITASPFTRVWKVLDWFPFQLKRLRAYLRAANVGRVTVKKRGSPLQPEALIQDLRLEGEDERVIVLTQLRGRPIVIICL